MENTVQKIPITDSNLSDLDKIIATAPSSDQFITPARRIRKQTERFTSAARDYWKGTIKDKGWQKTAPIPTKNAWSVPVSTPKPTPTLLSQQQQLERNPIIKKLQEEFKTLADKFQIRDSAHQKENKNFNKQSPD